MAKKSRGGRMTAAKKRAAKSPGGKGAVKKRPAGKRIMGTSPIRVGAPGRGHAALRCSGCTSRAALRLGLR